jgi:hypothetical protein
LEKKNMDENDSTSRPYRSRRLGKANREAAIDSEYNSAADVELTSEHFTFFREAGASEIFLTLIQANPKDAGVNRNSVQEETRQYVFYGYLDEDPENFSHEGGFFFTEIWDGKLYEAFRNQADIVNAALLEAVFGESSINEDRPSSDAPKVSELSPDRFFI